MIATIENVNTPISLSISARGSSAGTIPAAPPAAAPPAITSAHDGISTAPNHSLPLSPATSNPVKSGRIRVIKEDSGTPGYLILGPDQARFKFSTSPVNAVVVEWDSSLFPCKLKLVVRLRFYLFGQGEPTLTILHLGGGLFVSLLRGAVRH